MRQAIFIGNLKEAPVLRHTGTGTAVTDLVVIVKDRSGETWITNEFKCVCWATMAERMVRQAKAGSEVVVVCKPENREYTGKDGRSRRSLDYMVSWARVCLTDGTESKEVH